MFPQTVGVEVTRLTFLLRERRDSELSRSGLRSVLCPRPSRNFLEKVFDGNIFAARDLLLGFANSLDQIELLRNLRISGIIRQLLNCLKDLGFCWGLSRG